MQLKIDTSDLLRFVRTMEGMPARNRTAIARALNSVGDGVVRELSQRIGRQQGTNAERVRAMIDSTRATPANHRYEIRLREELPAAEDIMPRRRDEFEPGSLVIVVNFPDDKVCLVCQEIAAGSPYTIEDARTLIPAHGGPGHNCRCELKPFVSRRRLAVEGRHGIDTSMTMKQLAEQVRQELSLTLKVR